MATNVERYERAHAYVMRAIVAVERAALTSSVVPVLNGFEWYASRLRTETARNDLARLDVRWLRAIKELQRNVLAREMELLADRVAESLPGAPQDWQRTNLAVGEKPETAKAASLGEELRAQAAESWASVETSVVRPAASIIGWLLTGLAAVGGWRLWRQLRGDDADERRRLSRALARAVAQKS